MSMLVRDYKRRMLSKCLLKHDQHTLGRAKSATLSLAGHLATFNCVMIQCMLLTVSPEQAVPTAQAALTEFAATYCCECDATQQHALGN